MLYLSSVSDVIGWINTRVYDETGDAEQAQGGCPPVVDTNGDGKITDWVGLNEELDPTRDTQLGHWWYGIVPDPTVERVVWAASGWSIPDGVPGSIIRCHSEQPSRNLQDGVLRARRSRIRRRRSRATRREASISPPTGSSRPRCPAAATWRKCDRSKCDVFDGPTGDGQQCPQGWTLYATPGPTDGGGR